MAFSAAGARVWVTPLPTLMTPLPEGCGPWALTVDALRWRIYAATSCTVHGERAQVRLYALDIHGHLLWVKRGASDGWPALALDRNSGDVWLAT